MRRLHPLLQAGIAMGIAGAGRIAFQSAVAIGFGEDVLGRMGALLGGIMAAGGVAAAGPYGAVTLGIARKWAERPGALPRAYVALLLAATVVFLGVLVPPAFFLLGGPSPAAWWMTAVVVYAAYQILRAFGYAVQRADVVTFAEALGVIVPVAALPVLARLELAEDPRWLVGAYVAGLSVFMVALLAALRGRVSLSDAPITARERHLAVRESSIFALGAGSATAMQFLAPVVAERLDSTAAAAILFGALNATAPLLVLSRVYTTVMIPALAAGDETAGGVEAHARAIRAIFVPSTALALGGAPWIAVSLGMEISPFTVTTAAMVGLVTLTHVWATPAVTVLSARHRELVPALSSAGGLAVAALVWWLAVERRDPSLLPVGLALGAVVRSLVPAWVAEGRPFGALDLGAAAKLGALIAMCGVVFLCGVLDPLPSLALGGALAGAGLAGIVREWRRLRAGVSRGANA